MREYNVVQGNLLDSKDTVICHQVNCQGKMNSGVAKAIRTKYPKVYNEYLDFVSKYTVDGKSSSLLGNIQLVEVAESKYVINMFAQDRYGYDGGQYTSIEAFANCLAKINKSCAGCSVAFPWKIGCVRGGADWQTVLNMICMELTDVRSITFYHLDLG